MLARNVNLDVLRTDILTAMRGANIAPEFVYAFERTGLIVVSIFRDRFSAQTSMSGTTRSASTARSIQRTDPR